MNLRLSYHLKSQKLSYPTGSSAKSQRWQLQPSSCVVLTKTVCASVPLERVTVNVTNSQVIPVEKLVMACVAHLDFEFLEMPLRIAFISFKNQM